MSSAPKIGRAGLILGRDELPWISGSMHYFQHPSSAWGACLGGLRELGLELVDSCVPWSLHERAPGSLCFDEPGEAGENRDLVGFLQACQRHELKVVLRLGPCADASLTGFGYPSRVLADERCLARGARDNPVVLPAPPRFFCVPSYASAAFWAEAEPWLDAVARAVEPFCWPAGPVVAAQLDNELSLAWRSAAYDQDYHPDAVALFRRYLAERYPQGLPAAYTEPLSQLDPPRRMEAEHARELLPHLDWVAFKEWMLSEALGRMVTTVREAGLEGLPLLHNLPALRSGEACSFSASASQVDLLGLDLHLPRRDYKAVRRAAQEVAGSSPLPVLREVGWGGLPWWFPQQLDDQLSSVLAALMHGVRGINLYMAVERDRWYGAPISDSGQRYPHRFDLTQQLVSLVREAELLASEAPVQVGVLFVRDYRWLQRCTSLLDPLPPVGLQLLGVDPDTVAARELAEVSPEPHVYARFCAAACAHLDEAGVSYHRLDSERCETLKRYRLLVVPTMSFVDPRLISELALFTEGGGRLLFGPCLPTRGRDQEPLTVAPPMATLVEQAAGLPEALDTLCEDLALYPEVSADHPEVEVVLRRHGKESVLFVANCTESSASVEIVGWAEATGQQVWDGLSGLPVELSCLDLESGQVRVLCCGPKGER